MGTAKLKIRGKCKSRMRGGGSKGRRERGVSDGKRGMERRKEAGRKIERVRVMGGNGKNSGYT